MYVFVCYLQDNFVEMGGVRTLTALLHSKEPRVVYQAATAISYITSDSQENIVAVTADHGLDRQVKSYLNDICSYQIYLISCLKLYYVLEFGRLIVICVLSCMAVL